MDPTWISRGSYINDIIFDIGFNHSDSFYILNLDSMIQIHFIYKIKTRFSVNHIIFDIRFDDSNSFYM